VSSKTLASNEIRIITNVLNVDYTHNLIHLKEFMLKRLIFGLSVTKPVNMTHCKLWNSCIGIRHMSYVFSIWV